MFGLGIWEIAIIVVVILLIFKPEDIPKLIRNLGRVTRQLKDMYRGVSSVVHDIGRDVDYTSDATKGNSSYDKLWKRVSTGKEKTEDLREQ